MKQYEAVIKVMEQNGGYATLGHLYENALKVTGPEWKTKTPFASIRRIVQDDRFFFKIKPGLWALKSWQDRLPHEMKPSAKETPARLEFSHSYYQGLVIQIGNMKNFCTFVPHQDRNKAFLSKDTLGRLASLQDMYSFSYPHIVKCAKTVDVVWFNTRRMPARLFEVEHSTDMKNSLVKFVELQDFRTDMVIVSDQMRKRQFNKTLSLSAFDPIRKDVRFLSYQQVSDWHAHLFKLRTIGLPISML